MQLADMVAARAKDGKNYGIILLPEGLIEHVPEVSPGLAITLGWIHIYCWQCWEWCSRHCGPRPVAPPVWCLSDTRQVSDCDTYKTWWPG